MQKPAPPVPAVGNASVRQGNPVRAWSAVQRCLILGCESGSELRRANGKQKFRSSGTCQDAKLIAVSTVFAFGRDPVTAVQAYYLEKSKENVSGLIYPASSCV